MMDERGEGGGGGGGGDTIVVVVMGREKDLEDDDRKSGRALRSMRLSSSSSSSSWFCCFVYHGFFWWGVLSLLLLSLAVDSVEAQGSLQSDVVGLQVFRNAVDPTRKALSSWENATDLCVSWAGISCRRDRVYRIRLPGAGLAGTIPSGSLSLLDQLRVLSLHDNLLTGPFPTELFHCTSLQALYLDKNGFSGTLPSFWGMWHRLTHLSLSFNKLSGPIPQSIDTFSHLYLLDLENNSFSGLMPVLKLLNLTRFSVANNNLSGPVPSSLTKFPLSSWIGNHGICGPPTTVACPSPASAPQAGTPLLPPRPRSRSKKLGAGVEVAIVLGDIAVLVFIAIAAFLLYYWKRTGRQAAAKKEKIVGGRKLVTEKDDNPKKHQKDDDHADHSTICGQAVQESSIPADLGGKRVKGKSAAAAENDVRPKKHQQQQKKKKQKEEEYAIAGQGLKERNNRPVVVVPEAKRARGSSRSAAAAVKDKPGERYHEEDAYAISDQALQERNKLVFVRGTRFSFGLEDLLRASAEVLGKGTAGTAYRAILDDSTGSTVFVKRLKDATSGRKHFQMQIEIVGNLKHPNLVPLHAYFFSKEEKLLVYDYYSLGSLSSHLHADNHTRLDWGSRCKIALGAARGIACIHEGGRGRNSGCKYVHGNIKSSNVLLNSRMEVGISDFGLLQLLANSPVASKIVGYQAPEVAQTGKLTPQSDVYSFGVLLLELLTGKAPVQTSMNEEIGSSDLPHWVQSVVREVWIAKVFDAELKKYHNIEEEMLQMLQVAMVCVDSMPDMRPTMVEVVHMLQEIHPVLDMRDEEEEASPSSRQQSGPEDKSLTSGPQSARHYSQSYTRLSP